MVLGELRGQGRAGPAEPALPRSRDLTAERVNAGSDVHGQPVKGSDQSRWMIPTGRFATPW